MMMKIANDIARYRQHRWQSYMILKKLQSVTSGRIEDTIASPFVSVGVGLRSSLDFIFKWFYTLWPSSIFGPTAQLRPSCCVGPRKAAAITLFGVPWGTARRDTRELRNTGGTCEEEQMEVSSAEDNEKNKCLWARACNVGLNCWIKLLENITLYRSHSTWRLMFVIVKTGALKEKLLKALNYEFWIWVLEYAWEKFVSGTYIYINILRLKC